MAGPKRRRRFGKKLFPLFLCILLTTTLLFVHRARIRTRLRQRFAAPPLTTTTTTTFGPTSQFACPRNSTLIRVLFPHVNKAGGRTIEGTFAAHRVPRHRYLTALPISARFSRFSVTRSHRSYDEIAKVNSPIKGVCDVWTMALREPRARTLSAFYATTGRASPSGTDALAGAHFACRPGSRAATLMLDASTTFADFAALPFNERRECDDFSANLHVRYLTSFDVGAGRRSNGGLTDAQALELAKIRLASFGAFVITESYDDSMRWMSHAFRLDLVRYSPVFNVNEVRSGELTYSEMRALDELNALDLELYAFALALFKSGVASVPVKVPRFACDENVVCWTKKRKTYDGMWRVQKGAKGTRSVPVDVVSALKLSSSNVDDARGAIKENVLCAPEYGCARTLLSEPKVETGSRDGFGTARRL